jgi:thiamine biosynthesis lipoprotein
MLFDSFRAMNTDMLVAAEGDPAAVAVGFRRVREYVQEAEERFTRFSEDSELSRLNQSSGTWRTVSPELFEVIRTASECASASSGLFDPTILDALEAAGYDRSMDDVRTTGPGPERSPRPIAGSMADVRIDESLRAVFLPHGLRLDLGGIAKGWIAEQAVGLLAPMTGACAVNAGGDMYAAGLPAEGAWKVALEHPLHPEQVLTILALGPGAVATSSTTRRTWEQAKENRHHIIDPRTRKPAVTDWLSMTVIAKHAAVAEVYAKVLLIAGRASTRAIAADSGQPLTYIGVDRDGRLWGSDDAWRIVENGADEFGAMAPARNLCDARA